ncbi:MAG: hypothetical protein ABSC22_00660 [Roseiarcus sp.]|jgi:hypothetical protein
MSEIADVAKKKKRRSGIPTGNAGEYLVMGELLRRGFDAQLADRNTKGYDLVAGAHDASALRRVQVKTVRAQPWFVRRSSFKGELLDQITVYVLLGPEKSEKPVRFFMAKNRDLEKHAHYPEGWAEHGFMSLKAIEEYENRWDILAQ